MDIVLLVAPMEPPKVEVALLLSNTFFDISMLFPSMCIAPLVGAEFPLNLLFEMVVFVLELVILSLMAPPKIVAVFFVNVLFSMVAYPVWYKLIAPPCCALLLVNVLPII